jgi:ketosteroid isomerase-like protein
MTMTITTEETVAAQVRPAFDQWTDAWNQGHIDGYMACYAQGPHTRYVSGTTCIVGYDAIVERIRQAGIPHQQQQLELIQFQVEDIGDSLEHVLVFGQYQLTNMGGDNESQQQQQGYFTVHLQKFDSVGWKIVSDHSS